jgi:hypothetical protein
LFFGSGALKVVGMQHALAFSKAEFSEDTNARFNVVIAYEDFETGKHAKRTYDFLVENLGSDCHFTNQMWKFDVLSIPKLREIACADAANADIVVISCHGDDLPQHVKDWIESWLAAAGQPLALVALFGEACRTNPARKYLKQAARRRHLEFFAQPPERLDRKDKRNIIQLRPGNNLNQRTLSTIAGAVCRDFSGPKWESPD